MDTGAYDRTRRQLHGIAEVLIAGPQYREHGTIRLVVRDGGFGGAVLPVTIDGTVLVWSGGRAPLTGTARQLAATIGVEPGAPVDSYPAGSGLDLDEPLQIDTASAKEIASWFALGDAGLRAFAPEVQPVLWPEHFDLAITVDKVNYGVSPGDAAHPEIYAYVGPPTVPTGDFWNVSFGALREAGDVGTSVGLVEFFTTGAKAAHA